MVDDRQADGRDAPAHGFLVEPDPTPEVTRLYDDDADGLGFVMNLTKVWAHLPAAMDGLADLLKLATGAGSLTFRQRGVIIAALAPVAGDSYCSLAWGNKLAGASDAELAGSVLRGEDHGLDDAERVLARWARQLAREPSATRPEQVQELREVGYDDRQIFAITLFIALRLAFATVNDALGARPDKELAEQAPEQVLRAITFGRPIATAEG